MNNKIKILIVDDRAEGLLTIQAILQDLGHEIITANCGQSALRRVLEHDFALIILDVQMPIFDGYETAKSIRQRERSRITPIIFVTASHQLETNVFQGYMSGAVDYLFKPVDPDILKMKVHIFVNLFLQKKEIEDLNMELACKIKQLTTLNSDLESFSYSVSHDLKAPLRAIEGLSEMIKESGVLQGNKDAFSLFEKIQKSSKRMGSLIEGFLELGKVNQSNLNRSFVDLSDIARKIVSDIVDADGSRESKVTIKEGLSCQGDYFLIKVALENLINNAWKFASKKSHTEIELGSTIIDGKEWIFIRDNGIGFDKKNAEKIFLPFQRLRSYEEFPGNGVGLSTVCRIIQRHGGKIWSESEPEKGTTFYFRFVNSESK